MLASVRDVWVRVALAVSLAVPLYFLIAAWGVKFGLMDWTFGFGVMTLRWGPYLLYAGTAIALSALLVSLVVSPARGWALALVALAIPVSMMGYGAVVREQARGIAPIHDVTTDFVEPPTFSDAVIAARARVPSGNDLELLTARIPQEARFGAMAGKPVTEAQQQAYPDIGSIPSGLAPDVVFDMALETARAQRWRLGAVDKEEGRIEGVAESFWFGFKDDVVIRIRPDGSGSRVDMRSTSRVGVSDLGANARRMRAYLSALRERLEAAES